MRYAVLYERNPDGTVSAMVPDLPGCVAAADTIEEARELIKEAVTLHIAGLREDGDPIPPAVTEADYVDAA
jgi:predicted RNase H-like HicB family nuclease